MLLAWIRLGGCKKAKGFIDFPSSFFIISHNGKSDAKMPDTVSIVFLKFDDSWASLWLHLSLSDCGGTFPWMGFVMDCIYTNRQSTPFVYVLMGYLYQKSNGSEESQDWDLWCRVHGFVLVNRTTQRGRQGVGRCGSPALPPLILNFWNSATTGGKFLSNSW